ncbi:MAG: oxamate carbamoyltransferase subunit AllH family protein [Solirubrobacteraceae bacterium]
MTGPARAVTDRDAAAWTSPLTPAPERQRAAIRARGRAILADLRVVFPHGAPGAELAPRLVAAGVASQCEAGLALLLDSIATREAAAGAHAGAALIGLGPGLTPEGDDLIAGAAAVIYACSSAAGWSSSQRQSWLDAVAPEHLRRRTTPLSAALLGHAVRGEAVKPLHALLDFTDAGERGWRRALDGLRQTGASTGGAYAAAAGAAAYLAAY